ncbi:hypothetical protein KAU33_03445, partial [Candidatus Dependentiae bacterium]|nr:hypothetical protein [Candidatus Dependentiae bacterium]
MGYVENLKLLSIDLPYYISLRIEVKNDLEIDKYKSELIKLLKEDDNDNIKKKIFGLLNDIKNTFNTDSCKA